MIIVQSHPKNKFSISLSFKLLVMTHQRTWIRWLKLRVNIRIKKEKNKKIILISKKIQLLAIGVTCLSKKRNQSLKLL